MNINRNTAQLSDGEESDDDYCRRRMERSDIITVNARAGRLEVNVEDALAKARQRAARFSQSQRLATQKATVTTLLPHNSNDRNESRGKNLQSTTSSSIGPKSSENASSSRPLVQDSNRDVEAAKTAPIVAVDKSAEMAVSQTGSQMASGSREATASGCEGTNVKKVAPFAFRRPTKIKGPSQKTFNVYFTEPQFEEEEMQCDELPDNTQQLSSSPPTNRISNMQSSSIQRSYGDSQQRSAQQANIPLKSNYGKAKQQSYIRSASGTSQELKGRGYWRGRGLSRPGRMKSAAVRIKRGPISQTRLVLNPLPDNIAPSDQSRCAYRHSSPIASTASRDDSYILSRASSPKMVTIDEYRRRFYSSSNTSEHSFQSRARPSISKHLGRLPHSSSIRGRIQEEAASEFSWKAPLAAIDAQIHSTPSSSRFYPESGSDRRTIQYNTGVFNQDPAKELQVSKSRLDEYKWNSNESSKLLKTASIRGQVPSTPRQGSASKNRRGMFDPSTVLQSCSSSSPHASTSRVRLPIMQSSASWGSSQIHGPNGNTRNSSAAIVIDSDEDEFDDGGFQDEDLVDIDTEDYY